MTGEVDDGGQPPEVPIEGAPADAGEEFLIGGAPPEVLKSIVDVVRAEPGVELLRVHGDPATPNLLLVNAAPAAIESLKQKIAGSAVVEPNAPLEGGPAIEDFD